MNLKEDEDAKGESSGQSMSANHSNDNTLCSNDIEMTSIESKIKQEEGEEKNPSKIESNFRERRKTKSKYGNMANDDLEKMLKWKNGVGYLPGSNLKFYKSDSGLDLMMHSSDEGETNDGKNDKDTPTSSGASRRGGRRRKSGNPKDEETEVGKVEGDLEKTKSKQRKKVKIGEDKVLKCETCGCVGNILEFRSSGRFCSQRCVGAYASKKRAEMIAQQFASGERAIPKSGRRVIRRKKGQDSSCTNVEEDTQDMVDPTTLTIANDIKDDSILYYQQVGFGQDFNYDDYLKITKAKPVPEDIFLKEYPGQLSYFEKGSHFKASMKLECIDPKHQSCFCVVSVVEVQGARLRLHFDGWSESYDFWINADSSFLFPCGWCEKHGQVLQPPKGIRTFNWATYLEQTGCEAAPNFLFRDHSQVTHGFKTNMKLEAVDRKNPDLICVASVTNSIGDHFLIHFDEWDDSYDYWCKDNSPFIHPVGWCAQNTVTLVPPTDDMVNKFLWEDYLKSTNTIAAPNHIFNTRTEPKFEIGSKLEVVDPRNPSLVRLSTIVVLEEYRIKLHFDGWDNIYDGWFDTDSVDLHPVRWAEKTGHLLEYPPSGNEIEENLCGTRGCRGIGHFKGAKFTTHHTSFGCPYTAYNINRTPPPIVDRLTHNAMAEEHSIANRIYKRKFGSPKEDISPDSTPKLEHEGKSRGTPGRSVGRPPKTMNGNTPSINTKVTRGKRGGFRRRRRRSNMDVTPSTTNQSNNIHEEHSNSYLTKPIPSTHRPANQSNMMYRQPNIIPSKAIPWTQTEVLDFLKKIGYEDLVPSFKEHQIDGQALLLLSQADLVHHLKLKLGPALKIYSEISKL